MTIVDSSLLPDDDTLRARWADQLADELGGGSAPDPSPGRAGRQDSSRGLAESRRHRPAGDRRRRGDEPRRVPTDLPGRVAGVAEWRGDGETFLGSFPSAAGTGNYGPQMTVVRGSSIPVLWQHEGSRSVTRSRIGSRATSSTCGSRSTTRDCGNGHSSGAELLTGDPDW